LVTLFQTLHTLSYVVADRTAGRLKALKDDEKGASAIEYAILVAAIALVVVVAVGTLGNKIKALFDSVSLSTTPPKTT
jgi:pilus assembly protein Flp/PilA